MPLYEYRCERGHLTEQLMTFQARADVIACPDCGEPAERVMSATNWQYGDGPKESPVSAAIGRVRKAEREGRL